MKSIKQHTRESIDCKTTVEVVLHYGGGEWTVRVTVRQIQGRFIKREMQVGGFGMITRLNETWDPFSLFRFYQIMLAVEPELFPDMPIEAAGRLTEPTLDPNLAGDCALDLGLNEGYHINLHRSPLPEWYLDAVLAELTNIDINPHIAAMITHSMRYSSIPTVYWPKFLALGGILTPEQSDEAALTSSRLVIIFLEALSDAIHFAKIPSKFQEDFTDVMRLALLRLLEKSNQINFTDYQKDLLVGAVLASSVGSLVTQHLKFMPTTLTRINSLRLASWWIQGRHPEELDHAEIEVQLLDIFKQWVDLPKMRTLLYDEYA